MWGEKNRGSQGNSAMVIEAQYELYQAVQAHKFDLEITSGVSALDQEILDSRIEVVQRLLEWLSPILEADHPPSLAVQTRQSSRDTDSNPCPSDRRQPPPADALTGEY
jgi:hypothetical protein